MTREARSHVAILLGAITVRLVVTDSFGWFVHQRMRYPLLIAGVALVVIGLYDLFHPDSESDEAQSDDEDHAHEHHGGSDRVGWLLALPVLVLFGVSPTALGADSVDQFRTFDASPTVNSLPPLPSSGTIELSLMDYQMYAMNSTELRGKTVTLTGFVVADAALSADSFVLTRFAIGCCAADAFRLEVVVNGAVQTWENDTWLRVTGTWLEPAGGSYPTDSEPIFELRAAEITQISEPDAPYESA